MYVLMTRDVDVMTRDVDVEAALDTTPSGGDEEM